ncbi:MAG TPA: glycosyltransferase family 87 protein [Acidimicrobiales bacterium]|nr:glycosyltransferase family 87 protein [Acidimicrobiales bacterium]
MSRPGVQRGLPWLAWTATRALGLVGLLGLWVYGHRHVMAGASDLALYWRWAFEAHHGMVPYVHIRMMYPPGVLPFMFLPWGSITAYRAAFLVLAFGADLVTFTRLRRHGQGSGAWVWIGAGALLGPVFWGRFDIFVAAAMVLAVLDHRRGRPARAAAWLGLAASIKLWPILLVLPVLRRSPAGRRLVVAAAAVAGPALLTLPVAAWGGLPGLLDTLRLQAGRGLEVESLFAVPLVVLHSLHAASYQPQLTIAWQFVGRAADLLATLASVAAVVAVAWWARLALRSGERARSLGLLSFVLAVAVVATGKVISPQYGVWVAAGAAVAVGEVGRGRRALLVCSGAFLASTQALFPFLFHGLLAGAPAAAAAGVVHGATVLALALAAVRVARNPNPTAVTMLETQSVPHRDSTLPPGSLSPADPVLHPESTREREGCPARAAAAGLVPVTVGGAPT